MKRCEWLNLKNDMYIKYHDEEWGEEVHEDNKLFEMLILEGAQAGLSWETVLKKRDNYKKSFDNFEPEKVANYSADKIKELLNNKGIIRNKLKINSAINNAKVFLKIKNDFGSFNNYIWEFVNYKQIKNHFEKIEDIPTQTDLSDKISKDLKNKGMNFVGSTIIYAYIQAIGMINDHTKVCYKYKK